MEGPAVLVRAERERALIVRASRFEVHLVTGRRISMRTSRQYRAAGDNAQSLGRQLRFSFAPFASVIRPASWWGWILLIIGASILTPGCAGGPNDGGQPLPIIRVSTQPSPVPVGQMGTAYDLLLQASSTGPVTGYVWSVTGAVPPGLAICPPPMTTLNDSCHLKGTPALAGQFTFTVRLVALLPGTTWQIADVPPTTITINAAP